MITTDDTGTETTIWGDIGGATGTGYTLAQADVGQALRVVVRFTDALGGRETLRSVKTGLVANVNDAATGPVRVTGVARQYETLRADPGEVADIDGAPAGGFGYRYQWQRSAAGADWADIAGATGSGYQLAQADVGQALRVVVRFTDALGGRETLRGVKTGSVANVNDVATGTLSILGSVTQRGLQAMLREVTEIDGPPPGGFVYRYQWQRGAAAVGQPVWADIPGATGTDYRLRAADVGQVIRVVVGFTDAFGAREVLRSEPTVRVPNITLPAARLTRRSGYDAGGLTGSRARMPGDVVDTMSLAAPGALGAVGDERAALRMPGRGTTVWGGRLRTGGLVCELPGGAPGSWAVWQLERPVGELTFKLSEALGLLAWGVSEDVLSLPAGVEYDSGTGVVRVAAGVDISVLSGLRLPLRLADGCRVWLRLQVRPAAGEQLEVVAGVDDGGAVAAADGAAAAGPERGGELIKPIEENDDER